MLRRTNQRADGRTDGRRRRRRRNNILGGEGKEENDGAKRRTLKRGERRSRRGGGGGIPARSLRENTRCEAYDVVKTSTFFYRWKERESGAARPVSEYKYGTRVAPLLLLVRCAPRRS